MSTSHKWLWSLVVIIVLIILGTLAYYAFTPSSQPASSDQTASAQTIQATFTCDGGKTIDATFTNATTATTTGNSVMLALSDSRQMTLPQTISADGARYSNGNPQAAEGQPGAETIVFWNVGNTATFMENGTTTYNNCVSQNSQ